MQSAIRPIRLSTPRVKPTKTVGHNYSKEVNPVTGEFYTYIPGSQYALPGQTPQHFALENARNQKKENAARRQAEVENSVGIDSSYMSAPTMKHPGQVINPSQFYASPVNNLVSSTDQLRQQRQSNRLQAADIMSSIQDTINPLNL